VREPLFTWANVTTMTRIVAGVAIFAYAAATRSATWNYVGLGVFWTLDILDGFLARTLDEETRFGAQLDILADRLLAAFFYLNYVALYPQLVVPAALFLVHFMLLDQFLSNQFMRWPIKSPNYFYSVDREIWWWNWSSMGKVFNSAIVTVVMIATKSPVWSSVACIIVMAVKAKTALRMRGLTPPEHSWPRVG